MLFENLEQHFIPLCTELWLLPLEYGTEGPKVCVPKELQPTKQIIVNNDSAKKVNVHNAV